MNSIYIFGYGSLLNPASRARTFRERRVFTDVILHGYQRKLNATSELWDNIYMNIVPNDTMSIRGVVVEIPRIDFPKLLEREKGYEPVEVTSQLSIPFTAPVFTFVAPDQPHGNKQAFQTYIDTCLGGVPMAEHEVWLSETIIECEVFDDRQTTRYRDAA